MASKRPEYSGPPEFFYNSTEARKYSTNTHIIDVQERMSERALELLALPDDQPSFLLDIGCGSGISGDILSASGHAWIGVDISEAMLDVALEREVDGDLVLLDMGSSGIPFRAGTFDGAISISALQWLCVSNTSDQHPSRRLYRFFASLYSSLARGARAVFQFYPETSAQIDLITQQAMRAGFTGGVVIDFPHSTKAKKLYLVLFVGGAQPLPAALDDDDEMEQGATFSARRETGRRDVRRPVKKSREWIKEKKERWRLKGKSVREDSKFTGRKRKRF